MSAISYLRTTDPAVKHLFDGLNEYDSLVIPSIKGYIDENGFVRMTRAENQAFLKAHKDWINFEYARATLAGSILQVAYVGLKKYSNANGVSQTYTHLDVGQGTIAERMCVGRDVHGIPIGLLIYTGRVQYNHWEDGKLTNPAVRAVFRELVTAYSDNPYFDMVYVLDYPVPRPVSYYIVRMELHWETHEDYTTDMNSMLGVNK